MGAELSAFACGALALLGALELARQAGRGAAAGAPAVSAGLLRLATTVRRAGEEGRDPGAADRRRVLAAGAVVAGSAATFLAGALPGLMAAAVGPLLTSRALLARRERYRRAVERDAAAMAMALAGALGGGHSLRSAIGEAAAGTGGAGGVELRRVAVELAAGAQTDDALEALRARVGTANVHTIVAAALLQHRAGGDLAGLLRECAKGFEDQARLEDEVRAATAQARFTGLLVVLLPIGGALLAELASPGFLSGLAGSALTVWLVGMALGLQVVAAVAIRRLGRVRG